MLASMAWWGCGQANLNDDVSGERDAQEVGQMSRRQLEPFRLLAGPSEPLPRRLEGMLNGAEVVGAEAQRLPLTYAQMWVVPGANKLCLVKIDEDGSVGVVCRRVR